MVFCLMVIFGFACWNSSTSLSIEGPSPPVKPFQYDNVMAGPVYLPVNLESLEVLPPATSSADLPPPQAVSAAPAATPPPAARNPRREIPVLSVLICCASCSVVRWVRGSSVGPEPVELRGR